MGIIDLLFPKKCLECGKNGQYICKNCVQKVRPARLTCLACEKASIDGVTHVSCEKTQMIDGCYSPFKYEGVIRKAILSFKYRLAHDLSKELAVFVADKVKSDINPLPSEAVLVPIPLYKKRERERGFNQAELVGEIVAKKMQWDYVSDLLTRKEFKKPQAELKGEERRKNILGAFSFNKKHRSLITDHQSLILFDDVATTGSTLKEAAKVLKRNGVETVWGLTIAR